MVKLGLLPLVLLVVPFLANEDVRPDYRSFINTEVNERGNYTVTSVKDDYLAASNIRIYKFDENPIDEIADTAFVGTTFDSVVISKDITHINNAVFENATNIVNIYYTGSLEEFALLNINFDVNHVYPYSVDEGFINYWNSNIRTNKDINICNITRDQYNQTMTLYNDLIKTDVDVVNNYVDAAGYKISDSIKELIRVFSDIPSPKKKDEWNQTGAITLIIVIAVIGTTAITVFYLLKTKNYIS